MAVDHSSGSTRMTGTRRVLMPVEAHRHQHSRDLLKCACSPKCFAICEVPCFVRRVGRDSGRHYLYVQFRDLRNGSST